MTPPARDGRVIGVGIDLVDVDRLRTALGRTAGLADRLFTPTEQDAAATQPDPVAELAVHFAAKEAVMKALGRGIGAVAFTDVEVGPAPDGTATVELAGRARELAAEVGASTWQVTVERSATLARAVAIATGDDGGRRGRMAR